MSSRREQIVELSHRIFSMRQDAQKIEEELQRLRRLISEAESELDRFLGEGGTLGLSPGSPKERTGRGTPTNPTRVVPEVVVDEDMRRRVLEAHRAAVALQEQQRQLEETLTLREKILSLLGHYSRPMSVSMVAASLRVSLNTMRTVLWRMERNGDVVKVDKATYRLRLPSEPVALSAEPAEEVEQE